ncbi:hypothetical protein Purlil1_11072 [Purpureocillium lilacinum]|uniref:Uncharacterized protein n=1 Tax=Purpureocillium lilacinum TaxID=33203 RepID=A0ABR0BLE3_PURLI|nr:hypothetical protein Purlil1_11072 [Purpureocillium lilacinum]
MECHGSCDAESEFNLEAQVRTDAGWGGRAASNENEPEGDGTGRCVITGSTRSMISYHHHRSPPLTTTIHHIRPTNVTTTHSTSALFFIAIATTTCDTDGYLVHHNPPAPPLASRLHHSTLLHIHTPNTIRLPAKPPSSSSSSSSNNCYPPPSFRTTPRHRAPPRSVNDPRVQVQAIHGGDVRTGVPVRLRRRGRRSAAQRDVHQACVHPKLPYMAHPAFRSYTLARLLTACVPVHLVVICAGLALLLACITRPLQDGPSRFSHATWVSACFVATAALLWTASSTAEMQPPPFPHQQQQQMQGVVADDDGGQLNLYLRRRKRLVVAATVTGVFMGFATVISWIVGAVAVLDKKDERKKQRQAAAAAATATATATDTPAPTKDKEDKLS